MNNNCITVRIGDAYYKPAEYKLTTGFGEYPCYDFRVYLDPSRKVAEGPAKSCLIKKVHFNPPATVVLWVDGSKTVVKAQEDDEYDPEKGLAMAIAKKALGNKGNFNDVFKKWLEPYYEKEWECLREWEKELENNTLQLLASLRKCNSDSKDSDAE